MIGTEEPIPEDERSYLEEEYGDVGEGRWTPSTRRPARRPWVAALLSLLVPGLGHVYVGEVRRGLRLWSALIALVVVPAWAGLLDHFWGMVAVMACVAGLYLYVLWDAQWKARSLDHFEPGPEQRWTVYAGITLFAATVVSPWLGFLVPVKSYFVPSAANEPTIRAGDRLMARKVDLAEGDVSRHDLVIYRSVENPDVTQLHRVVGLPGDEIEIVDKVVSVDGEALDESRYVRFADPRTYREDSSSVALRVARDQLGPFRVPPGHVFVLGDNRDRSYDSRFSGPVPISSIEARPLYVYWSRVPAGPVRLDRVGVRLH